MWNVSMKIAVSYPGLSATDQPMGPAPLSAAILHGPMLFVSGQVGINPHTGLLAGIDIVSQTRQTLTNIQALVEAAGMGMADVVKVGIFLTDVAMFDAMNAVYATFFSAPFPARATVGILLNRADLLVEMDAIAVH